MNDSYEIIDNQIKYYLTDDLTRGWNNIPSPQYGVGLYMLCIGRDTKFVNDILFLGGKTC
ncbi:hypothetical protein [Bacillus wiedmannii]|uniref:hypothetical protein n=1 Tax=Bacillus wiedmannii TaxID=1890302 RepID=UPI0008587318|nr:hypothetical protein [Bacillus wiedmannii]SCM12489.1 Protein of unknown function [Bacillus wiedmannii]